MLDTLNCPVCRKTKAVWQSFFMFIFGGYVVGTFTALIYGLGAVALGFDLANIGVLIRLPLLAGLTAFIWFIVLNDKKFICSCEATQC